MGGEGVEAKLAAALMAKTFLAYRALDKKLWTAAKNKLDSMEQTPIVKGAKVFVNTELWINRAMHGFRKDLELKEEDFGLPEAMEQGVFFGRMGVPEEKDLKMLKKHASGELIKKISDRRVLGKPVEKDGHILVVGGAGSGKSACIAIPTLKYFWPGRFVAVDIKGELAEKSGRDAVVFNPLNPDTEGYDPFYLARKSQNYVSHIRDIALALVPTLPNAKEPFWTQAAQSILTGHLLFAFKNGGTFLDAIQVIQKVSPQKLVETAGKDDEAVMHVGQAFGMPEQTLSSIMAQIKNVTAPLATDMDIINAFSKRDILTPDILEQGKDIFLQIPEYRIKAWGGLITLILQQFLSHFERREEGNDTPILFLLDEFPRFGKLEGILDGLATLRSKKITICIIIQSLAQLDAIYGQNERKVIADNCGYKAVLRATDADTQRYFSQLVGTEMVQQETVSTHRELGMTMMGGVSTTMVEKPLIRPEEFAYLDKELVAFFPTGSSKIEKVGYYQM
jgi:type IV secretion system protein VirD4